MGAVLRDTLASDGEGFALPSFFFTDAVFADKMGAELTEMKKN